jgi:hypothetical protein
MKKLQDPGLTAYSPGGVEMVKYGGGQSGRERSFFHLPVPLSTADPPVGSTYQRHKKRC